MVMPQMAGRPGVRREPALVLILSLLTCGIYYIWWIGQISQETQDFLMEPDMSPGMEMLLSIATCFLYTYYWDYKMGQKIARMQERVGLPVRDNSILYLILDFVQLGFLPPLIQQQQLNEIWQAIESERYR